MTRVLYTILSWRYLAISQNMPCFNADPLSTLRILRGHGLLSLPKRNITLIKINRNATKYSICTVAKGVCFTVDINRLHFPATHFLLRHEKNEIICCKGKLLLMTGQMGHFVVIQSNFTVRLLIINEETVVTSLYLRPSTLTIRHHKTLHI